MNRKVLMEAGIDYDQGVERFAGHPAIYEKYLRKLFEDSALTDLGAQLRAGAYEEAFRTAHNLKGMSGNLSVNVFYQKISVLTDLLRGGAPQEDPLPLYEEAVSLYQAAEQAVKE